MSRWVSVLVGMGLWAGMFLLTFALHARAVELVMIEQPGCAYCVAWHNEIAPAYPKTDQGTFAPLRTVELKAVETSGIDVARRVNFTPTFLLVDDDQEIARMEGYAGSEFFWVLLDRLLLEYTDYEPSVVND